MQVYCTNCGRALRKDMRLCPFCGKLVRPPMKAPSPQQNRRRTAPVSQSSAETRQPSRQRAAAPQSRPAPLKQQPVAPERAKRQILPPRVMRIVYRVLTVAVVLFGMYAAAYIIQVYRVKSATYPFETRMKLTYSTYGQAFDEYFDDGSWSVNPFNITCTYKGKSSHGEDYSIVFSAGGRIKVKSITIDDKEIDKGIFEEKLLGMFI